MNVILVLVFFSLVYFLAHLFATIFSRTKIPDVLGLIAIGLCLGPLTGIIGTSQLEMIGPVFATLALVIILFESGLSISFDTLLKTWAQGMRLTTINFLASFIVVSLLVSYLTDLSLLNSFLLGAIVTGISPAVVVPLLDQLKLKRETVAILKMESALADILCIVVGLALLDASKGIAVNFGILVRDEIASFFFACVLGVFGAVLWSISLNRMRTLKCSVLATPAFVLLIFGMAELIECSGYVAALAFGITLGNIDILQRKLKKVKLFKASIRQFPVAEINEVEQQFFSEVVFLLKTFFFVYIGISIQLNNLWFLYIGLVLAVAALIVRIPVVRFTISKTTPADDVSLMAIMIPKGLATAALASLPLQEGITGGEIIQNVAFAIVLLSIVSSSILIFLINKTVLLKFYRWIFSAFDQQPPSPAV